MAAQKAPRNYQKNKKDCLEMIIINFKNYKIGKDVLKLAKHIQRHLPKATVAVPASYIGYVTFRTKLTVYAQHVDYQEKGRNTGFLIPEVIKSAGAKGTLLNHSEHKISMKDINKTIKRCNKLRLSVIACASNLREAVQLKKLKPYAIAFEDPELVGTGISITRYKTNYLKKFVSLLKGTKIIPLCGAGIDSKEDYKEALKLGCKGVLVSTIIMKSKNSEKFLKSFS